MSSARIGMPERFPVNCWIYTLKAAIPPLRPVSLVVTSLLQYSNHGETQALIRILSAGRHESN
jgi:hypothetical protein